jgi:hypothetical protein
MQTRSQTLKSVSNMQTRNQKNKKVVDSIESVNMQTRSQKNKKVEFVLDTITEPIKMQTRTQKNKKVEIILDSISEPIKMQTRSQHEQIPLYSVDIDFDGASEAWRANKKLLPNCCYQYICGQMTISGNKCCRKPYRDNERCSLHYKK